MEVLREINLEKWTATIVCPGCHSLLEFKGNDIFCSEGFEYISHNIKCISCNCSTEIDTDKIPNIFLAKARNKYLEENPPWYKILWNILFGNKK